MPGAPSDIDTLLSDLARRRQSQHEDAEELQKEIRRAIRRAQSVMPIAEIARRLEIDRSTIYRVYLDAA